MAPHEGPESQVSLHGEQVHIETRVRPHCLSGRAVIMNKCKVVRVTWGGGGAARPARYC